MHMWWAVGRTFKSSSFTSCGNGDRQRSALHKADTKDANKQETTNQKKEKEAMGSTWTSHYNVSDPHNNNSPVLEAQGVMHTD